VVQDIGVLFGSVKTWGRWASGAAFDTRPGAERDSPSPDAGTENP